MATLPRKLCTFRWFCGALEALLVCGILATAGCAQRVYRAADLPKQYVPPPIDDIEEINLSKLVNYAINSQLIDRDDVLEVTIVTDLGNLQSTTTPVRVDPDGTANVPLIGPVPVAGLELTAAEQAIAGAAFARGVFRRPHVTVTMKQQRMNRISVIGAVKEEGVYELARTGSTLLAALVSAGGLAEDAASEVEIHHAVPPGALPGAVPQHPPHVAGTGSGVQPATYLQPVGGPAAGPLVTCISLADAARQADTGSHLNDGDVVVVKKRTPKPIYVIGLVREPGEIELPASKDMYLLDAIAKAGERTLQIADRVTIRRQVPGEEEPIVIVCSVRRAKRKGSDNVRLAPGDVVSVEETVETIAMDTLRSVLRVTLGGSLAVF